MLCKVNISERDAVCDRFKLNKMPQKGSRPFTEVVEDWLLRPRNPHADEVILDAVQRRQERHDDAQRAYTTSADNDTCDAVYRNRRSSLVKLQGEQQGETWLLPSDRPVLGGRSGTRPRLWISICGQIWRFQATCPDLV